MAETACGPIPPLVSCFRPVAWMFPQRLIEWPVDRCLVGSHWSVMSPTRSVSLCSGRLLVGTFVALFFNLLTLLSVRNKPFTYVSEGTATTPTCTPSSLCSSIFPHPQTFFFYLSQLCGVFFLHMLFYCSSGQWSFANPRSRWGQFGFYHILGIIGTKENTGSLLYG